MTVKIGRKARLWMTVDIFSLHGSGGQDVHVDPEMQPWRKGRFLIHTDDRIVDGQMGRLCARCVLDMPQRQLEGEL